MPPRGFQAPSVPDLENAAQTLLAVLYAVPPEPLITKTTPKTDRNAELRALYAQGWTPKKLSQKYGISRTRVHEIVRSIQFRMLAISTIVVTENPHVYEIKQCEDAESAYQDIGGG